MTEEERSANLEWCRAFIDHHCVFRSPPGQFHLVSRSGSLSSWQFYMPVALLDQEFAARIGALFWDRFSTEFKRRPFQLCGCESGGILLMCALQAAAFEAGQAVNGFAVKKEKKDYGIGNWLEGVAYEGTPVLLLDDVVGMKRTLTTQANRLISFGLDLIGAFCIAAVKLKGPISIDLGGKPLGVQTFFGPADFAHTHEQYVAKYGTQPQFWGSLR